MANRHKNRGYTPPRSQQRPATPPPGPSTSKKSFTADSFLNVAADLGIGANNLMSQSAYGFNPITRNRVQLDYMYRGSWIVKQVVDAIPDDMTRAGISYNTDLPPDDTDALTKYLQQLQVWQRLNATLKWSRLYGGAIAVMMIDGQRPDTPLNISTIGRGSFKGLLVLDRWMLQPFSDEVVIDLGAEFGDWKYYTVVADARGLPNMKIHHSRVIRFEGVQLPYWQKMTENGWGLSVVEPLFDRLLAFDSATTGAAQLVYKAHLRVYGVDGYRDIVAAGGPVYQAFVQSMNLMRQYQSNEGITIIDKEDSFQFNAYAFAGLSDMLIQFGQQLAGAAQTPLTRLFGQSPAGLNSTGEGDMRNYYDSVNATQESRLRGPLNLVLNIAYRSRFGKPLPDGFDYSFNPLWQLKDDEKANIAQTVTGAVTQALEAGVITPATALKELRQSSRTTGIYTNITDEDIEEAENAPPDVNEMMPGGMPNNEGSGPPGPGDDVLTHQGPKTDLLDTSAHDNAAYIRDDSILPFHEFEGNIHVVVETKKGEQRTGHGWAVQMPADYGYIRGTRSQEGAQEQMDAFVGPNPASKRVFVIYQKDLTTGEFDEHKVMLGYDTEADAIRDYDAAFADGRGLERRMEVRGLSLAALKVWLLSWAYGQTKPGLRVAR